MLSLVFIGIRLEQQFGFGMLILYGIPKFQTGPEKNRQNVQKELIMNFEMEKEIWNRKYESPFNSPCIRFLTVEYNKHLCCNSTSEVFSCSL